MQGLGSQIRVIGAGLILTLLLVGCGGPRKPAPVEDRGAMGGNTSISSLDGLPMTDSSGRPLLGIENMGKPGYYRVRPGDTVMRIGLETGQNWRDIVHWNNLENANLIEVGQVLRVIPPLGSGTAGSTWTPSATQVTAPSSSSTTASPIKPTTSTTPASVDDDMGWIWPAQGQVLAGFDETKNSKGVDISGRAGDAVLAAADGRVIYAGAGLRGYGNLIILKHNNQYLTAYAHNQTLLVKEDQSVQKGQKIAEMGNSEADRIKLHFEIRRQGKPVDPVRYLPAR